MDSKSNKTIGFLAVILLTFGITYLNFENLSSSENVKPYLMLAIGIATLVYWFKTRSQAK